MTRTALILIAGAAALGSCNPYNPSLGERPFRCGVEEPRCPDGYVCIERSQTERFCERADDIKLDAAPVPDGSGPFVCADDSQIEPNDELANAYVTGIPDSGMPSITLSSLAVCPAGDTDLYEFRVATSGQTARAEIAFNPEHGPLTVRILAGNGSPISPMTMAPEPGVRFAELPIFAVGTYYAEVSGEGAEGGTVENNYEITVSVTN